MRGKLYFCIALIVTFVFVAVAQDPHPVKVMHTMVRLMPYSYDEMSMGGMNAMTDGYIIYCSDCAVPATPGSKCAKGTSSAGAEAHKIRGQWVCF